MTNLYKMIKNNFGDSRPSPFGVNEEKRDVSLIVHRVGNDYPKADHKMAVENDAREIRIMKHF